MAENEAPSNSQNEPESPLPFDQNFAQGKTAWDWMSLLLAPLLITFCGALFSYQFSQGQLDVQYAQATSNAEVARDNAQETALQDYFDRIEELLLKDGLKEAKSTDEPAVIAKTLTLTVFRRLDGKRNSSVLRLLSNAGLIQGDPPIIRFSGDELSKVDLTGADLFGADLNGVSLIQAHMDEADLRDATLTSANLFGVKLKNANLGGVHLDGNATMDSADLTGADLTGAILDTLHLSEAHLNKAKLTDATLLMADLRGADLSGANLGGATLSGAKIDEYTKFDEDTTLPNGRKWTPGTDLTKFGLIIEN
jgi:uncharacterized protein YjbI with pentapeptide repeats